MGESAGVRPYIICSEAYDRPFDVGALHRSSLPTQVKRTDLSDGAENNLLGLPHEVIQVEL